MIEVELPDGTIAEFPDDTPHDVIQGVLRKQFGSAPQPEAQQPSVAGDVLASGASGAARGIADLAAMPSNVGDLVHSGLGWLTDKALGTETRGASQQYYSDRNQGINEALGVNLFPEDGGSLLGSGNLRRGMSWLTGGGSDYQPQTTAGEYARTVGEFAPSAALAPGNMLQKGVQVVAPALASETAGQATEGTALEPYARIAAALGAGFATNAAMPRSAAQTPSASAIKQSAGYGDDMTDLLRGAKLSRDAYGNIVRDLWSDVKDAGVSYDVAQNFGRTLQNEVKMTFQNGPSLHDLERLRRAIRSAGGGTLDTPNQAIAGRLIDKLDDAVENLSANQIASSGAQGKPVLDVLKEARETYRIGKKAEIIETAMRKAQDQASGVENGLRIQFRSILNNDKLRRQFSKTEQEAIQQLVKGDFSTNALRFLGTFGFPIDQGRNWMGAMLGSSGAGAMAGSVFGPGVGTAVGAATALGGTAAKYAASRATQNQAGIVDALVKSGSQGSQMYQNAMALQGEARRMAIARALLQSSIASQTGVPVGR